MNAVLPRCLLALLLGLFAMSLQAETPVAAPAAAAPKPKQYAYLLHLVPRLYDDKAWTPDDEAAVGRHFQRLKLATERGQVLAAGRSDESGDRSFGIVVFEAADEAAARAFMEADDAVRAGVMTAELHPFMLVLQRKPKS